MSAEIPSRDLGEYLATGPAVREGPSVACPLVPPRDLVGAAGLAVRHGRLCAGLDHFYFFFLSLFFLVLFFVSSSLVRVVS